MAKKWITVSRVEGRASRQAHADLPEGTYEREISKEGFFGPAAFMYHRRPPTGWVKFEGPLRPRAFNLAALDEATASPWAAPLVLRNRACEIRFWKLDAPMPALARNADGDQLLFVHEGEGDLFCDWGRLAFEAGDYIVLPRGAMWRLAPRRGAAILMVEATNAHYALPEKGLLGGHAIFDPAMLDAPKIDDVFKGHQEEDGETRVEIKKRGAVSIATYPYNPLDVVGWHGELSPVRINIRHIRPIMSHRYHVPPSAHTTFISDRFVVCTFAPRPFETDPGAIKVPFFHNNDDYDEVLFYHAGDFFSRDNIAAGMMTFHPSGFTHGPHPKALRNMFEQKKPMTDEYAVMIDTRDPLDIGEGAAAAEVADYVDSWKGGA
ncbi:homogentisate 1,2-dioxygenase [Amphiplicatus metriothermophilus]|uniref:Homogentisate 1,2-dioxygenase n=1 Tax=Amphiplicatus metriothermophilus TaxID=1519374 RepID=A0A239Q011_9PROT|nr:homogentisate 1,2-dioxygenase [Amphiplicatus metriothermophilus]MBB5520178.1 homogentisate 1,2-dioxygenase [Amphiplicatus metriothermophilus]SNT75911.1 homogentisate 1,2-dioxygenase [Amphiplicatus metriothermophilus]